MNKKIILLLLVSTALSSFTTEALSPKVKAWLEVVSGVGLTSLGCYGVAKKVEDKNEEIDFHNARELISLLRADDVITPSLEEYRERRRRKQERIDRIITRGLLKRESTKEQQDRIQEMASYEKENYYLDRYNDAHNDGRLKPGIGLLNVLGL